MYIVHMKTLTQMVMETTSRQPYQAYWRELPIDQIAKGPDDKWQRLPTPRCPDYRNRYLLLTLSLCNVHCMMRKRTMMATIIELFGDQVVQNDWNFIFDLRGLIVR